jgi:hypothetical protein
MAQNDVTRTCPDEARFISDEKLRKLRDSLLARGFARELKQYDPPKDVEFLVKNAYESASGEKSPVDLLAIPLTDHLFKFKFLSLCASRLNHEVTNSDLHSLKTVGDVVNYYMTPVRGINSYDKLARDQDNLPSNLFVLPEPKIFDPNDTTAFHKGIDAFPGMFKRVNGLRAAKKFPSVKKEIHWPDI